MRQLTYSQIEQCEEIQQWLRGFPDRREGAIEMLLRLRFVTTDQYSTWLKRELEMRLGTPLAVFVVRKFQKAVDCEDASFGCIWDESGKPQLRPAQAQGSEDLVQSVVANVKRSATETLLDHPSIEELREKRVRDICLLDDSMGSGNRVAEYIRRMLSNKHRSENYCRILGEAT